MYNYETQILGVGLLFGPGSKFLKKWEVPFKKSASKIVGFLVLESVKYGWAFLISSRNFSILVYFICTKSVYIKPVNTITINKPIFELTLS